MPFHESMVEFFLRHGGTGDNRHTNVFRVDTPFNAWLCPDGAVVRDLGSGFYQFMEPPTDPLHLLPARKAYHEEALDRIEEMFKTIKSGSLGGGFNPLYVQRWNDHLFGPCPEEPKEQLLQLREKAAGQRKIIAQIEKEFNDLPAIRMERERQESLKAFQRQRDEAIRKHRQEIEAIEL